MSVNIVMHGLSYLSPLILLAGSILGALTYMKNPSIARWIFWYFIASLSLDIVSRYWGVISSDKNNLFLFSVNGLIDLVFFSRLYTKFFQLNYRVLFQIVSISVAVVVLVNMVLLRSQSFVANFQAYDKLLCDGVIFSMALVSMFDLLRGKGELRTEIFRINVIVLLYFSLDMLMSLIINFLVNAGLKNLVAYFWFLRLGLLLTLYLILIYTLWQTGKNRKRWQYG